MLKLIKSVILQIRNVSSCPVPVLVDNVCFLLAGYIACVLSMGVLVGGLILPTAGSLRLRCQVTRGYIAIV